MTSRTNVEAVINTLEHERYARGALLSAFRDEIRAAIPERAPESSRVVTALARAESGEMDEDSFQELLTDLREIVRTAA